MILINVERQTANFKITDPHQFKQKMLTWATTFEVCSYLDSNDHTKDDYQAYDLLIGAGYESELKNEAGNHFSSLQNYHESCKDWLFGFLTYDLKNEVERLDSNNEDHLGFPVMHFFQPSVVLQLKGSRIYIHSLEASPTAIFQELSATEIEEVRRGSNLPSLQTRFSKIEYLETVARIREHIIAGDVYELNFCQEFFVEDAVIDPLDIFKKLNALSKAPFACFYKLRDRFLLCASPERYLKKTGSKVYSQPIKGTIRRGINIKEDRQLSEALRNSKKDRAENVMIVDLVRNDLARFCRPGTVKVEELFGIYQFEQVFQMISTISGVQKEGLHFVDALRNTFPMGSMTGAPKIMAMQLIEHYEKSKRGVYSGAIGYITPEGDFDFNVVIRSILYHAEQNYLSFQVGGAIVFDSSPEAEYEECLLKAKAILEILQLEAEI